VIEFGTAREVLFACTTPLEFADVLRLRNSDGSLDTEASVVAVQYHPGATIVAARFLHAVPNWIVNHDSILFIIAGVIACSRPGGAVVERGRPLHPIYVELAREFVIDAPPFAALDEPVDAPDRETVEHSQQWLQDMDDRIQVNQLRQFLQTSSAGRWRMA